MQYKIFSYLDDLIETYKQPTQRVDGLVRDPKEIIRTVEFYSSSEFLSGDKDELGREKPFYNVGNYRVTVAKIATDLDIKDIEFEPDSLKHSIQTMVINKELFKLLKEIKFSLTLNDMGITRPKYGGVLTKTTHVGGKLEIGVIDWVNVDFDPGDVLGGAIIETFYLSPSEIQDKADVWYEIDDVLVEHSKISKGKPTKIEVKEISGVFPVSFYKECAGEDVSDADKRTYKRMCFYIAIVGKKKFVLYYEYEKKSKFRYLPWEKIGNGLGRGVWEDGFKSQIATNDAMISYKKIMDLACKTVITTDSQKMSGNALTGVDTGHIFQLEPGRTAQVMNLMPSAIPELRNLIELWQQQYDRVASTYDANTGEAPTAGTPYSQTALLNQVANSPFEYRREEWSIFLNEILNEDILPYLKKKILKNHILVADYDDDELNLIDESIANFNLKKVIKEEFLKGNFIKPDEAAQMKSEMMEQLRKFGGKREIEVPEGWLDIEGKITANITGELKNKGVILQSLDSIFKTVVSTFNPQTGQYAALQDPTLSKVFGQIVEMSGVPFVAGQFRSRPVSQVPTMQANQQPVTIQ